MAKHIKKKHMFILRRKKHEIFSLSDCGNKETEENLFPGIFTLGTAFETTDREIVGLYGCPKCSTVQFCSDLDYIQYRKMKYKEARK